MVGKARSHLAGLIEADESTISGPAKRKRGVGVAVAKHTSLAKCRHSKHSSNNTWPVSLSSPQCNCERQICIDSSNLD